VTEPVLQNLACDFNDFYGLVVPPTSDLRIQGLKSGSYRGYAIYWGLSSSTLFFNVYITFQDIS